MVRCPICKSRGFDKLNSLMNHVHSAHAGQSIFMCSVCEKTFSHSQSINRHLNNSKSCICATKISSDQWDGGKNVDIHAVIEDAGVDDVTIDTEIEKSVKMILNLGLKMKSSRILYPKISLTMILCRHGDQTQKLISLSGVHCPQRPYQQALRSASSLNMKKLLKYLKPYGGTVTPSLRPLMLGMMKC